MLQNKKIVVIGGTGGLGLSAVQAFIGHGAKVVAVGRNEANCATAQAELGTENATVLSGDASHEETAPRAIQTCLDQWGGFDGIYHVAGGSGRKFGDGPLHEMSLEGWNYTINLNLTSIMLSNRAAIRTFLDLGQGGVILNMGSVLGFSPSVSYFTTHAYAACKSALVGFCKATAAYYAKHNIRINVVAPALVDTPMATRAVGDDKIIDFIKTKQPLDGGRVGYPSDYDGIASLLLSDQGSFITGQVFVVDGGWTVSEGQIQAQ
jgi:NAD(P)-dependent dehydrogenase (short-subunit alcohol dehydrogenase family)